MRRVFSRLVFHEAALGNEPVHLLEDPGLFRDGLAGDFRPLFLLEIQVAQ